MMKFNHSVRKQKGLTITELMVAVAVGLVVSAAVAGLFLQTSSSNKQNNEIGYIQDNGRYALKVISDDLEMSNFWAGMSASDRGSIMVDNVNIAKDGATETVIASIDDTLNGCSAGTANWNYDFNQPLVYLNNTSKAAAQGIFPCITNAPELITGTDVVMIKRTKGLEISANQVDGRPYIRGNRTVATLHKYQNGSTAAPPAGFFDWQYLTHIYYIARDCDTCEPKLVRQALKEDSTPANDPDFATEELAAGIERFNIQFGIDNNSDGVADFFTSNPTNIQILDAVTAKVFVLARAKNEIRGYKNTKSYQLGDLAVAAANDGYYRRVFSTTVVMKNTQAVLEM